jgi:hypothetical protein
VPPSWLPFARVAFRYSYLYDFFVPRLVGEERGPILVAERRQQRDRRQRQLRLRGRERRVIWDRRRIVSA